MMPSRPALSRLSDRELMECLHAVVGRDRKLTAELLEHLGEVAVRGLCAREAEGSLYMYCVKVLRFSEGCAYKRIAAARVAREYPVVLDMVAKGDLHVSAINMLVPHLTAENHRELLTAAARKTKRELAEVLAERFPKPDAETRVRKLPERRAEVKSPQLSLTAAPALVPTTASLQGSDAQGAVASAMASASGFVTGQAGVPSPATLVVSSPAAAPMTVAPAYATARPQDRASVQPLSPGRYRLQLTLSRQGRDDLLRAQELMRHQQPNGDLAVVVERALSELVVKLEGRKFGRLKGRGRHGASAAAAKVAGDQPHLELSPGARATGDQPHLELSPGAKATGEQPHLDLSPGAKLRTAAHPGRGHIPRVCVPGCARPRVRPPSRYLPRALVREVVRRDGMQCTYVGPDGRRCQARHFLEFHHIVPLARGGKSTVANVCLRCTIHHGVDTVREFGAETVQRHRKKRRP